ncbi:XTP/dITP diphosphatase [Leuconostoc mesenteroides]|uniref:XTP/dITP diphosphatase n=2 Tax=Leuconostoc mesenteroides TaxID=1245 RepID=UPI001CBEAD36|nr:XTP/dITP diphosphatase [Leuconostoc mesenteroides]MBZ1531167.1 XTP/dITP diphosphatase [Leuconostoc mesenteroides]
MKLIIASNNTHKITEIEALLASISIDLPVVSLQEIGDVPEIVEDGTTFEENAVKKVETIAKVAPNDYILADDSGMSVDALNGEPGVYSARYAGDHDDQANIDKVLQKLAKVPNEQQTAHFNSVIALHSPKGSNLIVNGQVDGYITESERGQDGFGYDPIFFVPSMNKTFAEMSASEKNTISHRGLALQELGKKLPVWLKGE